LEPVTVMLEIEMLDRDCMLMFWILLPAFPFMDRPEMDSVPVHVALITTPDVVALVDAVTAKSCHCEPPAGTTTPVGLFCDRNVYEPNMSTASTVADVPPVFEKVTRTEKLMPPTYVPVPFVYAMLVMMIVARDNMETT
jgi:hypothetical protein